MFFANDNAWAELLGPGNNLVDVRDVQNLFLYAAILNEVIAADQLTCNEVLTMANGETTTV